MNISPEEAQESLAAVRQVTVWTSKVAMSDNAPFPLIWGFVWLIGCLASQFIPSGVAVGAIWGILLALGIAASTVVGARLGTRVRTESSARIALFYWALTGYTALCLWIAHPLTPLQVSLLVVLAVMFGWIVLGLWLNVVPLALFGVLEVVLAVLGYYLLPAYFPLWVALFGGGVLIGCGLYMLRCGNSHG